MPTDANASEYRQRAAALRRLADRLDHTPLLTLHQLAGHDTWTSPRVEECRTQLTLDQRRVREAADDLRAHAWRYERHAEALAAAAAVAAMQPP